MFKDKFTWKAWGKYAIVNFPYFNKEIDKVHRQNGYSISKALSQGVWIYELWKLPQTHLGYFKSSDDAKKHLQEYLKENSIK